MHSHLTFILHYLFW